MADEQQTSEPLLISVVVPVKNGMPWVEDQLRALAAQQIEVDWEVVVADNGSDDGTRSCVLRWSERYPHIHLVDASARRGAGAARNIGVRAARGRLLAFCDADDVVRPGWVASMSAALAGADLVAGVFDFSALDGVPKSIPVPAATRQLGFLPFALGANLAVRREVFEAVEGFCEELSPEEDVDLCWRLQLAGYRFAVTVDAAVEKRERTGVQAHVPGRLGLRTVRAAALRALPCGWHAARHTGRSQGLGLVGCRQSRAGQPEATPSVGAHVRHPRRPIGQFDSPAGVFSLAGSQRRERRSIKHRCVAC